MELIRTDKALAEAIGLPIAQVRTLRKRRLIPVIKRGPRSHFYSLPKVEAALEKLNR